MFDSHYSINRYRASQKLFLKTIRVFLSLRLLPYFSTTFVEPTTYLFCPEYLTIDQETGTLLNIQSETTIKSKIGLEDIHSLQALKAAGTGNALLNSYLDLDGKECDGLQAIRPEEMIPIDPTTGEIGDNLYGILAVLGLNGREKGPLIKAAEVLEELKGWSTFGNNLNSTEEEDTDPDRLYEDGEGSKIPFREIYQKQQPNMDLNRLNLEIQSKTPLGPSEHLDESHQLALQHAEKTVNRYSRRFLSRKRPIADIRDCEIACFLNTNHCEAWQWRNGTCFWGSPYPGRCSGKRPFYPYHERNWVEDYMMASQGLKPVENMVDDLLANRINARVFGGRFRYFKYDIPGVSTWKEKVADYSEYATLLKDSNFKGETSSDQDPNQMKQFNDFRFRFRIGYHDTKENLEFCQRTASPLDNPWPNIVADSVQKGVTLTSVSVEGVDVSVTSLQETSRYSLLRLRAAIIPDNLKTGRFLNFGIGNCKSIDPLYPFFHHRLNGEDAKLVDLPALNGYGFDQVEPSGKKCEKYSLKTKFITETVTPKNVMTLLREKTDYLASDTGSQRGVKPIKSIEFVILDIDSWEYGILKELVNAEKEKKLKVLVYMIEVANMFPPPWKYGLEYNEKQLQDSKSSSNQVHSYEILAGISFHMALDLLKDTHDFFMFPFPGDAVFVHKEITRNLGNPNLGIGPGNPLFPKYYPPNLKFPLDEFLCYGGSYLWYMYPVDVVRAFAGIGPEESNVENVIESSIHSNITAISDEIDSEKVRRSYILRAGSTPG